MKFNSLFLVVTLFLFACGSEESNQENNQESNDQEFENVDFVEEDESKDSIDLESFEDGPWDIITGRIDGYGPMFAMTLIYAPNNDLKGYYFYCNHQKVIQLEGFVEEDNVTYVLYETYKGKPTGYMEFEFYGEGKFNGFWAKSKDAKDQLSFEASILTSGDSSKDQLEEPTFEVYQNTHDINYYNWESDEDQIEEVVDELKVSYIHKDYMLFDLTATGVNYHTGQADGLAKFDDASTSVFKGEEGCILMFDFNNNSVDITESECEYYKGHNVWFEQTMDLKTD